MQINVAPSQVTTTYGFLTTTELLKNLLLICYQVTTDSNPVNYSIKQCLIVDLIISASLGNVVWL